MATIRDIRTRITAVTKTQKITRAMKMVSAAKLARAQNAIVSARPYAEKVQAVLAAVASGAEPDAHALLVRREEVRKLDLVIFTSDRGLCGAYNANLIKQAEMMIARRRPELDSVAVIPVGRKAKEYFARRHQGGVPCDWQGLPTVTPELAKEIADALIARFLSGEADETVLIFSEFKSALTQTPGDQLLLPLTPQESELSLAYEMEPNAAKVLARLVPQAVEFAVFRALLENQAGEHGARMTAMDSATNNCDDLIRNLTLDMNKARQSAITSELVEIVSGAEAL